jgi:hypothetical protein
MRQLAEFMAGVRGRREALLMISEGVEYDIYREPRAMRAVTAATPASSSDRNPALSLTSPLPLSGLPLKVYAGTYRAGADQVIVALSIEVDVSALDFDERDGTFTQQLGVGMVAIDPRGDIRQQSQQSVDLSFTKERLVLELEARSLIEPVRVGKREIEIRVRE